MLTEITISCFLTVKITGKSSREIFLRKPYRVGGRYRRSVGRSGPFGPKNRRRLLSNCLGGSRRVSLSIWAQGHLTPFETTRSAGRSTVGAPGVRRPFRVRDWSYGTKTDPQPVSVSKGKIR